MLLAWFGLASSMGRYGTVGHISQRMLKVLLVLGTMQSVAILHGSGNALAQSAPSPSFPPNPLESTEPDPLVPQLVIDRPLSPQELGVINAGADEIRIQAEARYQTGDLPGAFQLWIRELRLRRLLGVEQEVESLGRIGAVAWQESQTTEVRFITERLQEIELEVKAQTPTNYDLLLLIAQSYQQMRAIEPAVTLYQSVLQEARQQGDRVRETEILTAMGELYLAWFDYPAAANVYQQLLELARAQGDRLNEILYLEQLAYIYEQNRQPEQAIGAQQLLVNAYEQQQDYLKIAPVKIAIGNNYTQINRPDLAAPSYQEAFSVARSVQQYGYAGDALEQLATLYRSLERFEDALVVYQLLLDVEQQSYSQLGIMNTYDQIGQVYRQMGNQNQAIAAFRRGLDLARQLNYKVAYFTTQIEQGEAPPVQETAPAQETPPVQP